MSGNVEVRINSDMAILDALKRIEKSLDCRFEKNDKLYIDRQTKYLIRNKVRYAQWEYIFQELYIKENISANILMSEIIKDSWLIQGRLDEVAYKTYIKPIIDCVNSNIFYEIVEDILSEKIDSNKDFKYKLIEVYYSKIGMEKLRENIDKKNKYLADERIANICIDRIFESNKKLDFKLESFSEIYEVCKAMKLASRERQIMGKFKTLFDINRKQGSEIIEFIFERYIAKNVDNEKFWLSVMNLSELESLKFVERYSGRSTSIWGQGVSYDRFLLRSLLQGIFVENLNGEYKLQTIDTLERIWDNSRIHSDINFECEKFSNEHIRKDILTSRLRPVIQRNRNYRMDSVKAKKSISSATVRNLLIRSMLEVNQKHYDCIKELMEVKLDVRKERRLEYHIMVAKRLNNTESFLNFIIENLEVENFDEFILTFAYKSDSEVQDEIFRKLIKVCESNRMLNFKTKFEKFLVEKNIKTKDTVVYLKNNNYGLFKELYKRTI